MKFQVQQQQTLGTKVKTQEIARLSQKADLCKSWRGKKFSDAVINTQHQSLLPLLRVSKQGGGAILFLTDQLFTHHPSKNYKNLRFSAESHNSCSSSCKKTVCDVHRTVTSPHWWSINRTGSELLTSLAAEVHHPQQEDSKLVTKMSPNAYHPSNCQWRFPCRATVTPLHHWATSTWAQGVTQHLSATSATACPPPFTWHATPLITSVVSWQATSARWKAIWRVHEVRPRETIQRLPTNAPFHCTVTSPMAFVTWE